MHDSDRHHDSSDHSKPPVLSYCCPVTRASARPNPVAWWGFACGMLTLPICWSYLEACSIRPRHLWAFNDHYPAILVWVLLALAAIIFGVIGHGRGEQPNTAGKAPAFAGILAGLLALVIFGGGIIGGGIVWDRYASGHTACAGKLKEIGLACRMYADENRGWYPSCLGDCLPYLRTNHPEELLCRYGLDAEAAAGIVHATDPQNPAFWNYVYLGAGGRSPQATTVLLYENLANHPGKGMYVVYADIHVEWFSARDAAKLIASLPPRPASTPSTRAK